MRHLRSTLISATLLLSATGCTVPLSAPTPSDPTTTSVNAATLRRLDDWRIRAGLYDAHHAPALLDYVSDANIDDGAYADQCRAALQELRAHIPGLLRAPTERLRQDAARVHRANRSYLRACVKGRAVAWHHAKGAFDAAAGQANADYARAVGTDPTAYNAPKVFR